LLRLKTRGYCVRPRYKLAFWKDWRRSLRSEMTNFTAGTMDEWWPHDGKGPRCEQEDHPACNDGSLFSNTLHGIFGQHCPPFHWPWIFHERNSFGLGRLLLSTCGRHGPCPDWQDRRYLGKKADILFRISHLYTVFLSLRCGRLLLFSHCFQAATGRGWCHDFRNVHRHPDFCVSGWGEGPCPRNQCRLGLFGPFRRTLFRWIPDRAFWLAEYIPDQRSPGDNYLYPRPVENQAGVGWRERSERWTFRL